MSKSSQEINQQNILFAIQNTLSHRLQRFRQRTPTDDQLKPSYVEQLYGEGLNKMGKKVIEEAGEVLMAAKDCQHDNNAQNQQELINEVTDLWFHCMVLLTYYEGDIEQVMNEAIKRFGLSGLDEKKARQSNQKPTE